MPTILHLETATEICSVCISRDAEILSLKETAEGYNHSAIITLLIRDCLEAANLQFADLQAVALSQGPGSYTSLRIGTSAAKAICYAWDIPLIALDTLQCLALAAAQADLHGNNIRCVPLIDARRMEVYTAVFDQNGDVMTPTHAKIVGDGAFSELIEPGNTIRFCGNGVEKCKSLLQHPQMQFAPIVCSAAHLVPPAMKAFKNKAFTNLAYFSPFYFKAPNITTPKKKIL